MTMSETIERINANHEFMEGIIAADQALITALKEQRQALRQALEMMINCADHHRDFEEIRKANAVLRDTRY